MIPSAKSLRIYRRFAIVLLFAFVLENASAETVENETPSLASRISLDGEAASIRPPMGWRTAPSSNNALLLLLPPDSSHGASLNAFLNTNATRDLDKLKDEIVAKRSAGKDNWKLLDSERLSIDGKQALLMTYGQDVVEHEETKRCISMGCFVVVDEGLYVLNFNCLEAGFDALGRLPGNRYSRLRSKANSFL